MTAHGRPRVADRRDTRATPTEVRPGRARPASTGAPAAKGKSALRRPRARRGPPGLGAQPRTHRARRAGIGPLPGVRPRRGQARRVSRARRRSRCCACCFGRLSYLVPIALAALAAALHLRASSPLSSAWLLGAGAGPGRSGPAGRLGFRAPRPRSRRSRRSSREVYRDRAGWMGEVLYAGGVRVAGGVGVGIAAWILLVAGLSLVTGLTIRRAVTGTHARGGARQGRERSGRPGRSGTASPRPASRPARSTTPIWRGSGRARRMRPTCPRFEEEPDPPTTRTRRSTRTRRPWRGRDGASARCSTARPRSPTCTAKAEVRGAPPAAIVRDRATPRAPAETVVAAPLPTHDSRTGSRARRHERRSRRCRDARQAGSAARSGGRGLQWRAPYVLPDCGPPEEERRARSRPTVEATGRRPPCWWRPLRTSASTPAWSAWWSVPGSPATSSSWPRAPR